MHGVARGIKKIEFDFFFISIKIFQQIWFRCLCVCLFVRPTITYEPFVRFDSKFWVNGVKIEFVCLKLTEKSENVAHFSQIFLFFNQF